MSEIDYSKCDKDEIFPGKNGGYTFYGPSVKIALLGITLFVSSGFYYMIKQDDILKHPKKKEPFWILFWGTIVAIVWAVLANVK